MSIFCAAFNAVGVTLAQDIFSITAPSTCRVRLRDVKLSQYSDFGNLQAEILSVLLIRDYTSNSSGGSLLTATNLNKSGATSTATVRSNDTVLASGGSPITLIADGLNVASGWTLRDALHLSDNRINLPQEGIWIDRSGRLVVRITAPADSLTMNGVIVLEEV